MTETRVLAAVVMPIQMVELVLAAAVAVAHMISKPLMLAMAVLVLFLLEIIVKEDQSNVELCYC